MKESPPRNKLKERSGTPASESESSFNQFESGAPLIGVKVLSHSQHQSHHHHPKNQNSDDRSNSSFDTSFFDEAGMASSAASKEITDPFQDPFFTGAPPAPSPPVVVGGSIFISTVLHC